MRPSPRLEYERHCGAIPGSYFWTTPKVLRSVPILVSTRRLQDHYVDHVEQLSEMSELLSETNQRLRTARDLLLPRLMSGEVAV